MKTFSQNISILFYSFSSLLRTDLIGSSVPLGLTLASDLYDFVLQGKWGDNRKHCLFFHVILNVRG